MAARVPIGGALATACGVAVACTTPGLRQFADRPVVWSEADDATIPARPASSRLPRHPVAIGLRDYFAQEAERVLSLSSRQPALDVNAADEVPCSTWFCPRNHLAPLSLETIAKGPAEAQPPQPPFSIVEGKSVGESLGFIVRDGRGKRFLFKLDPAGHPGLASGPEVIGNLFFHAAGYNTPGAFSVRLENDDLELDPRAFYLQHGFERSRLTNGDVEAVLEEAAWDYQGRLWGVAVPWLDNAIGPFDMMGARSDDPNDGIPHERRRSLRASLILFAWLNVEDASAFNTLDALVEVERGERRFVRHYFIDFGAGLGSASYAPKIPFKGWERLVEVGRATKALATMGVYQRDWQQRRADWAEAVGKYPAIGWLPAGDWNPATFRTGRKVPAHMRMTDRDAYWGAKIVTSFTDQQIAAIVHQAGYDSDDAAHVERALRIRRDRIGRLYLSRVTAVERPAIAEEGRQICYTDLLGQRGLVDPRQIVVSFQVVDGSGRRMAAGAQRLTGPRVCLPIGPSRLVGQCSTMPRAMPGLGERTPVATYRVVTVSSTIAGAPAKPARIHLAWRASEKRFVVVGLERDE
ncbi:MAG: hypothetical protein V2A73_00050 [Pseudomonadota bacterium]